MQLHDILPVHFIRYTYQVRTYANQEFRYDHRQAKCTMLIISSQHLLVCGMYYAASQHLSSKVSAVET